MEINEVAEIENEKLVVNATNNVPPHQDAMTTTMAAAAEEGGYDDDVGTEYGDDNNDADNTKGGR